MTHVAAGLPPLEVAWTAFLHRADAFGENRGGAQRLLLEVVANTQLALGAGALA